MASELQRQVLIDRNTTHGLSRVHPTTYRTWKNVRARCRNPNNDDYPRYGGRGIKVCARWDDFALFFADMGPRPDGLTLDRINRDGDYEPVNCRWADKYQQANNRSNNWEITINGVTRTLQQWCNQFNIERTKVRYRLRIGMSPMDALTSGDLRSGKA